MAYGISSPLGIAGIILIILGIIMAIIGIVLLIISQTASVPWYIWVLLVSGVVLGIIGGIMLAVALAQVPKINKCDQKLLLSHPHNGYIQHTDIIQTSKCGQPSTVNHVDGDKNNNCISNIRYISVHK